MERWPNNIRVEGEEAFMDLTNERGEVVAVTVFDAIDILKVLANRRRWALSNLGRVVSHVKKDGRNVRVLLHRVILDPPEDLEIDHINRDPLDNRRCNLRIVTGSENCQNKVARSDSSTGIKGVYRTGSSRHKPFVADIQVNGKRKYLGRFATISEAAEAVREATLKYHTHSPLHQEQDDVS